MGKSKKIPNGKKAVPEKVKRQKHALRTSKSDARRRDEGLTRISIWVPMDQATRVTELARGLVHAHRATVGRTLVAESPEKLAIPKPWKNPTPRDDSRQGDLWL